MCYNCGKVGHKMNECWAGQDVGAVEELVEGTSARAVTVGGIWCVSQVTSFESPNAFAAFVSDDDDNDDDDEKEGDFPTLSKEPVTQRKSKMSRVKKSDWKRPSVSDEEEEPEMFYQSVKDLETEKNKAWEYFKKLEQWQEEMKEAEIWICPVEENDTKQIILGFQLAEVRRPLI